MVGDGGGDARQSQGDRPGFPGAGGGLRYGHRPREESGWVPRRGRGRRPGPASGRRSAGLRAGAMIGRQIRFCARFCEGTWSSRVSFVRRMRFSGGGFVAGGGLRGLGAGLLLYWWRGRWAGSPRDVLEARPGALVGPLVARGWPACPGARRLGPAGRRVSAACAPFPGWPSALYAGDQAVWGMVPVGLRCGRAG